MIGDLRALHNFAERKLDFQGDRIREGFTDRLIGNWISPPEKLHLLINWVATVTLLLLVTAESDSWTEAVSVDQPVKFPLTVGMTLRQNILPAGFDPTVV